MRKATVIFDVFKFDELKQQACKDSAIVFVMEELELETEEEVTPEVLADFEFYWDGQIYEFADAEEPVKKAKKKKRTTATFVKHIDVIDPEGDAPIVQVTIYKEKSGGMFGVDTSYIESEEPVYSPFGNGEINIEE